MKTAIDKTNPLWEWHKPSKEFKKLYKDKYGFNPTHLGIMSEKAYKLYLKLFNEKKNI